MSHQNEINNLKFMLAEAMAICRDRQKMNRQDEIEILELKEELAESKKEIESLKQEAFTLPDDVGNHEREFFIKQTCEDSKEILSLKQEIEELKKEAMRIWLNTNANNNCDKGRVKEMCEDHSIHFADYFDDDE
jgi:hypothetical protein